jgi:hypothetical protein
MRLCVGLYRIRALRASVVNSTENLGLIELHHGATEVTEENDEVGALARTESVASVPPW